MRARVLEIDNIEVEVIQDAENAVSVTASGRVTTTGWKEPELGAWMYFVPPADGILDFDFTAEAPSGIVGYMITPVVAKQSFAPPSWFKGVRVHASTNVKEASASSSESAVAGGDPSPWPWLVKQ